MRLITKIVSICCLGLSLLTPNLAIAHASHGEPLSDEQAIIKATEYTSMIVEKPEFMKELPLDVSWKTTDIKIHKKNLRYFIVSLYNASKEKTLYVLLDAYGDFHGANFNGTFEGL